MMIETAIAVVLALLALIFGIRHWKRESIDAKLARLSTSWPELDYKHSVVDLMKLLGLDSSLENRKRLAREYGWTGELTGSAEMNLFLIREIRRRH